MDDIKPVIKHFDVDLPLSSSSLADDRAYLALFGIIELFEQIGTNDEERDRVLRTMGELFK